jgi:hypothetical protein
MRPPNCTATSDALRMISRVSGTGVADEGSIMKLSVDALRGYFRPWMIGFAEATASG